MSWNPGRRFRRPRDVRGSGRSSPDGGAAAEARAGRLVRTPASTPAMRRAPSICVVSGKGGTGKTTLSASLAHLLARRRRTLLFDADLGVANAHILQDVTPEYTLVDVVEGRCAVRDVLVTVEEDLLLVGGGSGYSRMADLTAAELELVAAGLDELERDVDLLLVDSAAGLSAQTVTFATASDLVLLVTTPDLTAITDAYAFLKVFLRRRPDGDVLLVVNRARDERQATEAARRILDVSDKFLGRSPRWIATLPEDAAAFRSTQRRRPVVRAEPSSALARGLERLTAALEEELMELTPRGFARGLVAGEGTRSRPHG